MYMYIHKCRFHTRTGDRCIDSNVFANVLPKRSCRVRQGFLKKMGFMLLWYSGRLPKGTWIPAWLAKLL